MEAENLLKTRYEDFPGLEGRKHVRLGWVILFQVGKPLASGYSEGTHKTHGRG